MTAAQQREQAKQEFDAFLAECPSRFLLEVPKELTEEWEVGGRW